MASQTYGAGPPAGLDFTALGSLKLPANTLIGGVAPTLLTPGSVGSTVLARADQLTQIGWYSVKDFGAKGDAATDDTAAIQAAINAATSVAGSTGVVWFPKGSYIVAGNLAANERTTFLGAGRNTSRLVHTGTGVLLTVTHNTGSTALVAFCAENLTFVAGTNTAGAIVMNATGGYAFSASFSPQPTIRNCAFAAYNFGTNSSINPVCDYLTMNEMSIVAIESCSFVGPVSGVTAQQFNLRGIVCNGTSGIYVSNCLGYALKAFFTEQSVTPPNVMVSQGSSLVNCQAIACNIGYYGNQSQTTLVSNCTFDPCLAPFVSYSPIGLFVVNCDLSMSFGGAGNACVVLDNVYGGTPGNISFVNCSMQNFGCVGGDNIAILQQSTGAGLEYVSFVNCIIGATVATRYGINVKYLISSDFTNNTFLFLAGITSKVNYDVPSFVPATPYVFRSNKGINPVGALTSPAVPASGVVATNPFPYDCDVYVSLGGASSITAIVINGVTTNLVLGAFRVPSGGTIAVQYSGGGKPTLVWSGE